MSLKDQFNSKYPARMENDYVLSMNYTTNAGSTYIAVDFMTRTMVTRNGHGDGGVAVTPFSQLDRDMLINLRDTLIEMGGKPPELAPEASTNNFLPGKKFNL